MNQEKEITASSGYLMLFVTFVLLATAIVNFALTIIPVGIICLVLFVLTIPGYFFINPNGSMVLTLFGAYKGTVKKNGFYWTNPF